MSLTETCFYSRLYGSNDSVGDLEECFTGLMDPDYHGFLDERLFAYLMRNNIVGT